jgi:hypothetical protein
MRPLGGQGFGCQGFGAQRHNVGLILFFQGWNGSIPEPDREASGIVDPIHPHLMD